MKFGYVLPRGSARLAAESAKLAEDNGWDGFFVWEPVWGVDAWISLAAAAMVTKKIRLGTMISPLSRMRPWKIASETATLDQLSNGRVILSVGLGALDTGFAEFGEETNRKVRAELLDESLAILTGLWKGQPFEFSGRHYQIRPAHFMPPPPPVQTPRIPIWVVGLWNSPRSMERVLRYDGILPAKRDANHEFIEITPSDIREIRDFILQEKPELAGFDIVVEGQTPGKEPASEQENVRAFASAGATWWIEANWGLSETQDEAVLAKEISDRIRMGPPHI